MRHPHAEVIKAWADGTTIQLWSAANGWVDVPSFNSTNFTPSFNPEHKYRIKPKTIWFRVFKKKGALNLYISYAHNNAEMQSINHDLTYNDVGAKWISDWTEYSVED